MVTFRRTEEPVMEWGLWEGLSDKVLLCDWTTFSGCEIQNISVSHTVIL